MKGLLALSADFIERLSGAAGEAESEAYEARLASLLEADGDLANELVQVGRELTAADVALLPRLSWQWLCGFLASRSARPADDFLHALFDGTTNIVLRLRTIETVTSLPPDVEALRHYRLDRPPSMETFPHSWLRTRMQRIVGNRGQDRPDPGSVEQAYELLLLLLQVGNEVAMAAAAVLLAHEWVGRTELRTSMARLMEPFDEQMRTVWSEQLRL